jgi:hypothetical protein
MTRKEEIDNLLLHVQAWPQEDRVALAYQILRDMRKKTLEDPPRHTLAKARGIARGSGPAPTDADVRQWIDEHRMSKYGK